MHEGDAHRASYRSAFVGKRACITGGGGFIGSHLASELLDLGASVSIIDDLSASDGQHLWYLIDTYPERVGFCFASILEPRALAQAVADCEYVFHLAAMNSVPRSLEDPVRAFTVNTMGTVGVCAAADQAGAKRVVFAASSSAYGDDPALPKSEDMPAIPMSPYAASKLAGEAVMRSWFKSYGLSTVCLRFFNIFGPRQTADSPYAGVIPAFVRRLSACEAPLIYGDGEQTRDFTHVENAVHAVLLAAIADGSDVAGEVINVGCAGQTSINHLASLLAERTGHPEIAPEHAEARAGEVLHSVADITKARTLLGYQPIKTVDQGLAETVSWLMRRSTSQSSLPE